MARANYLFVLLFICACAVFIATTFRIRVKGFWRLFFMTDSVVLTVYLAWDFWAIVRRNWYFDPLQTIGITIANRVPIEEVLFFIVVPFVTILTYLALVKLTGWQSTPEKR